MDLETAFKVLDLPPNPTRAQLEEQYYKLTDELLIDPKRLDDIQKAYNIMKDHIHQLNPPPRKTGWQKAKEFIFNYKVQLSVGILAIIIAISLSYTLINGISEQRRLAKNPDDIQIGLFGDFDPDIKLDQIEKNIHDLFPEWDKINLHIQYAPGGPGTELDFKADQDAQTYLMTSKPDVLILDRHYFELYNDGTVFEKRIELNEGHTQLLHDEEGEIVGINLTDHPLFANTDLAKKEKFAIIPIEASQHDNAVAFFEKILASF